MRNYTFVVALLGVSIALSPVSFGADPSMVLAGDVSRAPAAAPLATQMVDVRAQSRRSSLGQITSVAAENLGQGTASRHRTTSVLPRSADSYNASVITGLSAQSELASARAYLGSLERPRRSLRRITQEMQAARSELTTLWTDVVDLEAQLVAAGGRNEWIERRLVSIRAEVQQRWSLSRDLGREHAKAKAFAAALSDVQILEAEVRIAQRATAEQPPSTGPNTMDRILPISTGPGRVMEHSGSTVSGG